MISKTLIVSAALVALSGAAIASPGEYGEYEEYYERRGPMPFEVLDRNDDGVITAEEHAKVRAERMQSRAEHGYRMRNAGRAPRFEQIDSDADGSISPNELQQFHAQRHQQRMERGRGW